MDDQYDVIIIGAGPAGSVTAWHASLGGAKVLLLEKDRDIGYPVRCAEGVGAAGLQSIVDPDSRWIANKIKGVDLISPHLKTIHILNEDFGFVLNRKIFDNFLAEKAAKAGAEVLTKAYAESLCFGENGRVNGVVFSHFGRRLSLRAKIVVGADGVESRVGRWAGIRTQLKMKDIETCVQYTMSNIDVKPDVCEFHFSRERSPGGYIWIFPKGDGIANVGIGISGEYARYKSPLRYLEKFVQEHFPKGSVLTTAVGGVPVSVTNRQIVKDGFMLVGDAAHQANPISGGGIVPAMVAGKLAGKVAAEAVQAGDVSQSFLEKYEKQWYRAEGRTQKIMYRLKEAVYKLTDDDLNKTADAVLSLPEEKRTMVSVFKKALFNRPTLILEALKVFKTSITEVFDPLS
ncbi:2-octaprenyl-3-methyl-6-methoxy-1,4-benzoquinol hydroxylase [bacterium BMS3Bbin03]|nr:2-octaprenyl-3-methyl-6-methoxy-1,4-benzoquinol hydroxylase [bacterium BMS3Bbin03]